MLKPKEKYRRSRSIARSFMGKQGWISDNELEKMGLDLKDPVIHEATDMPFPRELEPLCVKIRHFDNFGGRSKFSKSLLDAKRLRVEMGKNFIRYEINFRY